jgi:DDE superfamily endonuclease
MLTAHLREQQRLNRSLPEEKQRPSWDHFSGRISDTHFRRMFRMSRDAFGLLCGTICHRIGEATFKPEASLPQNARTNQTVASEIKVAVAIRMLAGGSYLDIGPLFDVSIGHLYYILNKFIEWILKTLEFPLAAFLRERNWVELRARSDAFAEKSNGVFYGTFGALDGLAVRIRSPTLKEVSDPGNYYCRKGFYALNVQAICDKAKRFLWCYPSNKGSTHDSAAFAASRLYDLLCEMAPELFELGFFIVGDSAYNLSSFLLTPYDSDDLKDDPHHAKDAFNYHLSSCRILIECAFGELVMRWGILWRTLAFELKKCGKIIQVCMLLHNFIVENRENDGEFFRDFNIRMDNVQAQLTRTTGEIPRPLLGKSHVH